jgi:hypothetical protein
MVYVFMAERVYATWISIWVNAKVIRRVIGKLADAWGFGTLMQGIQFERNGLVFGIMVCATLPQLICHV